MLALLATAALGLWLLLPGGALHAQSDGTITYDENGTGPVVTYTAEDPEGTPITSWRVTGTDAAAFMIENGVLRFVKSPDYETATDIAGTGESTAAAGDNKYEITVEATDSTGRTGMYPVMVEVENVDEAGTLTLSALQPQSATAFTATLTDPDGATSNPTWQWKKSTSKSGSFRDITGATSGTYTVTDDDTNYYLRATVTYTDPEGANKTAMVTSEYKSQAVRGANKPPKFADDQDPTADGVQAEAAREVNENVDPGTFVGDPVTADPQDGDVLTYTLPVEADRENFDIDEATGQIKTKAALNFETTPSYSVTVRATDPAGIPQVETAVEENSDIVTVAITVKDVNEPPAVTGTTSAETNDGAKLTFEETRGAITTALDTYTASDPENDTPITWSTAGADGDKFTVAAGSLQFKAKPDYENPTDADMDNVYEVTVTATAGGKAGTKTVKVTVENEEEAGTVTLSQVVPTQGIALKAELTDPDGNVRSLTWQWSITGASGVAGAGVTATADGDIANATSDTYTPTAGDVGGTLTATASYFDGESAPDATEKKTQSQEAGVVALDTRNKAPVFGDEDSDTPGVQNATATREVEENTKALAGSDDDDAADATDGAGDNVGAALTATDLKADGTAETLIYSLGGTDSDKFRVRQNGQIEVAAGTDLDYETKPTYMVTVIAADPFGVSSSIAVTIMVTDLNEVPEITGDKSPKHDESDGTPVVTYTAMDPEGTPITSWRVTGTDAAAFMIENGVLRFVKSPDYETATDIAGTGESTAAAGDNKYEITVEATDSTGRTGMYPVMVEVENVDEAGTLTLSALQPQSATAFTATLTDPDGATSNPTWQWKKSTSKSGSFRDITGATSGTYTVTDDDTNYYLRATVTYTDPEGANKTAMVTSEYKSQAVRGANKPPKFADDQDPTADGVQAEAAREVNENVDPGTFVGDPVTADPQDGDVLTYTLPVEADRENFDIDEATGQIKTKAALNFETTPSYSVTVRATDPAGIPQVETAVEENSDIVTVAITVKDVNEPPAVTGTTSAETNDGAKLTFEETRGAITTALDTYTASDPENDTPITWSTAGADGDKFTVAAGSLQFKAKPDYENPTDADMDNVYEVTVTATAGGKAGTKTVKVTVENEEEAGTVTLSQVVPTQGIALKAELTDPDGNVRSLTWQWSITGASGVAGAGVTATADGDIANATSDTYTPTAGDVGGTLTATASYFDGESAPDATEKKTQSQEAGVVALDTRNKAPVFGDEDSDTPGVQNATATREVEENTKALAGSDDDDAADATDGAGDNVGAALTATDLKADGTAETLIYSLGGTDSDKFRVRQNGQIEVAAGTDLDYETKPTYMVTVSAADPFGVSSSIAVTIMVKDLNEVPEIKKGSLSVSGMGSVSHPENNRNVGTYTATGSEAGMPTWTLEGADAGDFMLEGSGMSVMLRFRNSPNYEAPMDADRNNTYMVTVKATSGTLMPTQMVTVTVTNVNEDGTVNLLPMTSLVGTATTAALSDPDGKISATTWQWSRSMTMDGTFTDISGATSASYTPVAGDATYYLKATASYTDGHGSGKSAMATTESAVRSGLAIAGSAVVSYAENGTNAVATYTAEGPRSASARWSIEGEDATAFDMDSSSGELSFKSPPDYENPTDVHGQNTYRVTVKASAGSYMDTLEVTVTVTNVGEDGTVTLSSMAPVVGTELTATLSDPDGMVSATTWQWSRSMTMDGTFTDISGATSASYTPVAGDATYYLKATASYTDGHGPSKEAMATASTAVAEAQPDTLLARYDADNSGAIEKAEMIKAINDYLFGTGTDAITKAQMVEVINLYLFG